MAISGRQLRFRRWLSCDLVGYCEIATSACGLLAMTNLGAITVLAIARANRSCSAGSGMPLPYNGVCGRRSATKPTSLQGGH